MIECWKSWGKYVHITSWVGSKEDGILGVFRAIFAMIEVEKRCWKKPLYLLETIKFVNKTSLHINPKIPPPLKPTQYYPLGFKTHQGS